MRPSHTVFNYHLSGQTLSIPDIIKNNIETLQSGAVIFNGLSDEQYTHTQAPYFSASIGKHFRHILDHYFCFFSGLQSGKINYDQRQRDAKIETQRLHTLGEIQHLIEDLKKLAEHYSGIATDHVDSVHPLNVILSTSPITLSTYPAESSLARELVFLQGHTTHHYAIISTQLKFLEFPIDENFGVAASTQIYNQQTLCAP